MMMTMMMMMMMMMIIIIKVDIETAIITIYSALYLREKIFSIRKMGLKAGD